MILSLSSNEYIITLFAHKDCNGTGKYFHDEVLSAVSVYVYVCTHESTLHWNVLLTNN